jgi:hypothetical protein
MGEVQNLRGALPLKEATQRHMIVLSLERQRWTAQHQTEAGFAVGVHEPRVANLQPLVGSCRAGAQLNRTRSAFRTAFMLAFRWQNCLEALGHVAGRP